MYAAKKRTNWTKHSGDENRPRKIIKTIDQTPSLSCVNLLVIVTAVRHLCGGYARAPIEDRMVVCRVSIQARRTMNPQCEELNPSLVGYILADPCVVREDALAVLITLF